MNLPSTASVYAFGRHVASYAAILTGLLATLHLMTPEQVATAQAAFDQISDGVTKIIAGVTLLIPLGMGIIAAFTASPLWQLIAVAKNPSTPPAVKEAIAETVPAASPPAKP